MAENKNKDVNEPPVVVDEDVNESEVQLDPAEEAAKETYADDSVPEDTRDISFAREV